MNLNRASAYAPMMPNSKTRIVVLPATMTELISNGRSCHWREHGLVVLERRQAMG